MTEPLLEVDELAIEFDTRDGRRRVVDGITFQLAEGEVLGILGESGSGKTLTTMAVLGLVSGDPGVVGGHIRVHDGERSHDLLEDLGAYLHPSRTPDQRVRKDARRWRRRTRKRMKPLWGNVMTAVFQNPRASLNPLLTIGAQVEESTRLADPGLDRKAAYERSVAWLERVQMNDPFRVHGAYAHELSGGMCQRAMIAVALARKPRLLIADEPTTGLDTTVRAEIVELFQDLLAKHTRSMLYISHDVREVLYLADRVIVMRQGRIVETAKSAELRYGTGTRDPYTATLLAAADLDTEAQ